MSHFAIFTEKNKAALLGTTVFCYIRQVNGFDVEVVDAKKLANFLLFASALIPWALIKKSEWFRNRIGWEYTSKEMRPFVLMFLGLVALVLSYFLFYGAAYILGFV